MLFFWTLYLSKNPKKMHQFSQKYEAAQLFSTLIIKSPLFEKKKKDCNCYNLFKILVKLLKQG